MHLLVVASCTISERITTMYGFKKCRKHTKLPWYYIWNEQIYSISNPNDTIYNSIDKKIDAYMVYPHNHISDHLFFLRNWKIFTHQFCYLDNRYHLYRNFLGGSILCVLKFFSHKKKKKLPHHIKSSIVISNASLAC